MSESTKTRTTVVTDAEGVSYTMFVVDGIWDHSTFPDECTTVDYDDGGRVIGVEVLPAVSLRRI